MPAAKCTTEIIEKVRPLIESGVTWPTIATAVGVDDSTMHKWRHVGSATYHAEFAAMVTMAIEDREQGKIKAGQVEQSQKHTLKKTTWEYRSVDVRSLNDKEKDKAGVCWSEEDEDRTMTKNAPPPEMPPTSLLKGYLIDYAEQVLDMSVDTGLSVSEIRDECFLRVKELTVTVKVPIVSEQEVDPSQPAVKNVLTNTGKKDERWDFKEEHEHGIANSTLLDIAARMCGKKGGN